MYTPNHAQERSEERYQVSLSQRAQVEIIMLIRAGKNAVFAGYSSRVPREIWQVYYMDKVFYVVYDPEVLHSLITVKEKPRRSDILPAMLNIVRQARQNKRWFYDAA